jgi:hypothetical protein
MDARLRQLEGAFTSTGRKRDEDDDLEEDGGFSIDMDNAGTTPPKASITNRRTDGVGVETLPSGWRVVDASMGWRPTPIGVWVAMS